MNIWHRMIYKWSCRRSCRGYRYNVREITGDRDDKMINEGIDAVNEAIITSKGDKNLINY